MCSHYTAIKAREQMEKYFRVRDLRPPPKLDMWPRYAGEFIRRPPEWESGNEAVPARELVSGRWGLVSALARADGVAKSEKLSTFNARSEAADKSFTFSNAWKLGQRCIIPAEAVFEPDWRSGKAVPTRFFRADGTPLGIAGLWDRYRNAGGEWVNSYTMLTINADHDPLFKNYHKPQDEKRSVVFLPDDAYEPWLTALVAETRDFLLAYPSEQLVANQVPQTAQSK